MKANFAKGNINYKAENLIMTQMERWLKVGFEIKPTKAEQKHNCGQTSALKALRMKTNMTNRRQKK